MVERRLPPEQHGDAEHDAIHEAAADWFARLQEREISLEDTAAWQQWMAASAAHTAAFQRIEETWQRFDGLPRPALLRATALRADDYDGSLPVSDHRPIRHAHRSRWFALAASLAIVAAGLLAFLYMSPGVGTERLLETALGENRSVRLDDGSQVTLGGHTRLKVAFNAHSRRLQLMRGEAFFDVAQDAARPFSVRTDAATVTAVGTAFNVRSGESRVVVAVVEGRVLVEPAVPILQQRTSKRMPRQLDAGSRTVLDDSGVESMVELPDPQVAAAWRSGRLAFEREPLRYVLEDVNRYTSKPVVLGDETIGDLRITGTVVNDNVAGWIASLETAFDLRATEESHRIVLSKAR